MNAEKMTGVAVLLSILAGVALLGHAGRSGAVSRPPSRGPTVVNLRLGESGSQSNVRAGDRVVCRGRGTWVATLVPRPYREARAWAVAYNAKVVVNVSSPRHRSAQMSCKGR